MMPDGHALEVRAIGVGITGALNDSEPSILEQIGRGLHVGVKTDGVVYLVDFVGLHAQLATDAGVVFVGVGNDRVQAIVAAIELNDNELAAVGFGVSGERRTRKEGWDKRSERDESRGLQELAASGHRFFLSVQMGLGAG